MDSASREARTSAAFVSLTNTLVSDFDLVELMHTLIDACIDLMDTDAGGLLLADADGDLQLMASSAEDVDVVEVVQIAAEAGPCWDCFTTGQAMTLGDIENEGDSWPEFQRSALEKGYRSVHATPMRLHGQTIGTMNLFHTTVGALNERDIALAQALTDVATIAILQERGTRHLRDLQHATSTSARQPHRHRTGEGIDRPVPEPHHRRSIRGPSHPRPVHQPDIADPGPRRDRAAPRAHHTAPRRVRRRRRPTRPVLCLGGAGTLRG